MDDKRFDTITRGLTRDTSRRRVVGGVLAGAMALLTGATALEAKPGGIGKGNKGGAGKGRGKTKAKICHFREETGDYKVLTLGAPGAENHLKNHEEDAPYVDCCPGDTCPPRECSAGSCDATGTCTYVVTEGALCQNDTGTCDALGACIPNTTTP